MSPESSEQRLPHGNIVLQATPASSLSLSDTRLASLPMPHKEAGLNPLVDAAARLFSMTGKLRELPSCPEPEKWHAELLAEIDAFQELTQNLGYHPEYTLVSRYAICVTLDDAIAQTPWGNEGPWKACCPHGLFGSESSQRERFFLILERIILDPAQYIDLMEFMYICLSLGFRGHFQATEFGHQQLEQISDALYRQIRAYRGDFDRTLSPFPVKPSPAKTEILPQPFSAAPMLLMTASIILILFVGLGFILDTFSGQAHTRLAEIGHHPTHETLTA